MILDRPASQTNPTVKRNEPFVSVIVPTRNHARALQTAVASIVAQDYPAAGFEILIVDNGSTDDTRSISEKAIAANPGHRIKYILEPTPGLLSGRHRGAEEAQGAILVFVDDDIEVVAGWLAGIVSIFEDTSVHLVGGPSRPLYEVQPPKWMDRYLKIRNGHIICGSLSLFDIGPQTTPIDPTFVWGLNFSIRKETLLKLGGFHPDGVPANLLLLRGDGETGLSLKIRDRRLTTVYTSTAAVYHHIPKERLTAGYFERRYFAQGISDSYTQIRKNGGTHNVSVPVPALAVDLPGNASPYDRYAQHVYRRIENAYQNGFEHHFNAVKASSGLLEWVLKENYFDYSLPKLQQLPGVKPT